MKVIFQGIKTGKEIWDIIKNHYLNEDDWIKDREYNFIQYDLKNKNGVIYSESKIISTQEELKQQERQNIIYELKKTIPERETIKSVLSEEQLLQLEKDKLELKTLLGY